MLVDIDSRDLNKLASDLRRMDKDFGNAVRTELREPLRRMTSDLKFSARVQLPKFDNIPSNAAAGIRYSTSFRGYRIVRANKDSRGFTQSGYVDRTGYLRHPLFGNRDFWYGTDVGARGWWTLMVEKTLPRAVDEFSDAVLKVVDRLVKGDLSTSKVGRGTRLL